MPPNDDRLYEIVANLSALNAKFDAFLLTHASQNETITSLRTDLETLKTSLGDRIGSLEKWRWFLMGAAAAAGGSVGALMNGIT